MSYGSLYPDFSWSHSRDRSLTKCARAYFWRYYGSHNGWLPDASETVRLAYALKQLTSFPMIVGTAVHTCARDCALAARQGSARPTFEAMLARVSDALNRAVIGSRNREGFLRDPKRVVMLQDAWYSGRGEAGLAPALAKARTCLRNLESAALWEELEQCRPEWVVAPDGPEAFVHEGWPVYAGPDLVYRPDGRRVVILDWKTGDASDAALQIPLYALYCRTVLGIPFRDEEWFGRVINLSTGADTGQEITRIDLMRAAERVRQSVGAMHALLADVDCNEPRAMADFPVVEPERRRMCQYCPFLALCEPELAEA
jgi:hypothetical protein